MGQSYWPKELRSVNEHHDFCIACGQFQWLTRDEFIRANACQVERSVVRPQLQPHFR